MADYSKSWATGRQTVRGGIDTRYQGSDRHPAENGERDNSMKGFGTKIIHVDRYSQDMWEDYRNREQKEKEKKEKAEAKAKAEGLRYTVKNWPVLGNPTTKVEIKKVEAPKPKTLRIQEIRDYKDEELIEPPIIIRSSKKQVFGMVDERSHGIKRYRDESEAILAELEAMYEANGKWMEDKEAMEAFELNADIEESRDREYE